MESPAPPPPPHKRPRKVPLSRRKQRVNNGAGPARGAARVVFGENSGTPFVVHSYPSALQSNLDMQRASSGQDVAVTTGNGAQVSATIANPENLQIDATGQAPGINNMNGDSPDRIAQAMHLLTLEHNASTITDLPTDDELASLQDPQAALHEAIQTALSALHKLVLARQMLKSGGMQTPVYADYKMIDVGEEACASSSKGQTGSGMAVDAAYKAAAEGVETAKMQLVWAKEWLGEEQGRVRETVVRKGQGF